MNLYTVTYQDDEADREFTVYVGTQAAVVATKHTLKKDGMRSIRSEDADVPVDKAGLMAYLNTLTGPPSV